MESVETKERPAISWRASVASCEGPIGAYRQIEIERNLIAVVLQGAGMSDNRQHIVAPRFSKCQTASPNDRSDSGRQAILLLWRLGLSRRFV